MNSLKFLTLATLLLAASIAPAAAIDDYTPACGPTGITKACEAGLFAAFPGRYTLQLKIGERVFADRLDITYITRHAGMMSVAEVVSGYFSVPSIPFSGPIQNAKIGLAFDGPTNALGGAFELAFNVPIKENGNSFPVYFYVRGANSANACENQGTAYLDAARTQVLGKFNLIKDTSDCKCGN